MRYLLDSDWVIDALRGGRASARTRRRIEALTPEGIALSMISLAELSVGPNLVEDTFRQRAEMLDFVAQFTLLNIDPETCEVFGRIRAQLQQQGNPIGNFDMMIAATALQYDLTLLTNNRRHFQRIDGLRIETA